MGLAPWKTAGRLRGAKMPGLSGFPRTRTCSSTPVPSIQATAVRDCQVTCPASASCPCISCRASLRYSTSVARPESSGCWIHHSAHRRVAGAGVFVLRPSSQSQASIARFCSASARSCFEVLRWAPGNRRVGFQVGTNSDSTTWRISSSRDPSGPNSIWARWPE